MEQTQQSAKIESKVDRYMELHPEGEDLDEYLEKLDGYLSVMQADIDELPLSIRESDIDELEHTAKQLRNIHNMMDVAKELATKLEDELKDV